MSINRGLVIPKTGPPRPKIGPPLFSTGTVQWYVDIYVRPYYKITCRHTSLFTINHKIKEFIGASWYSILFRSLLLAYVIIGQIGETLVLDQQAHKNHHFFVWLIHSFSSKNYQQNKFKTVSKEEVWVLLVDFVVGYNLFDAHCTRPSIQWIYNKGQCVLVLCRCRYWVVYCSYIALVYVL